MATSTHRLSVITRHLEPVPTPCQQSDELAAVVIGGMVMDIQVHLVLCCLLVHMFGA